MSDLLAALLLVGSAVLICWLALTLIGVSLAGHWPWEDCVRDDPTVYGEWRRRRERECRQWHWWNIVDFITGGRR